MIEYLEGDIFKSPAQVIVNAVNTVGVMGKGIALEFKKRYPKMFESYQKACDKKTFKMGRLMLCHETDHLLLLFPTKENWRFPSKIEYIEQGLANFVNNYAKLNINSVAFPKLGCGNGELDWQTVRPVMEKYLKPLPIDIYIYLKTVDSIPEHKQTLQMQNWLRQNAKDMSFVGLKEDISNLTLMFPFEFEYKNQTVKAKYSNGMIFELQGQILNLKEDEFFEFWDNFRQKKLIKLVDLDERFILLCQMLSSLGYLSQTNILNKQTQKMESGFQLNEGLGRNFYYKDDENGI